MTTARIQELIGNMFQSLSLHIPSFEQSDADWKNCQGNVAACIIDEEGNVYGKIWGTDKLKGRRYFENAWRKASQVWITGYATNEFERLVFSDQINYKEFGIELPDLIGWLGGQPILLDDKTKIYCGFSGFRGVTDISVMKKAAEEVLTQK